MRLEKPTKTPAEWQKFINRQTTYRCDLNILLKDEWRHKIVPRDDSLRFYPTKQKEVIIDRKNYELVTKLLQQNNKISLHSLITFALHMVLKAYGYGNMTIVAMLQISDFRKWGTHKVLPIVADHSKETDLPCVVAIERIESFLQNNAFIEANDLLGQRLFDVALLVTDQYISMPDETQIPLFSFVIENTTEQCLVWKLSYASELFEGKVITGILDIAREVMLQIAESQTCNANQQCIAHDHMMHVKDLELVSNAHKRRLLEWNKTDGDYPDHLRLNELFEMAANKTPDMKALIFKDICMTYIQVDTISSQLAAQLRAFAVERNKFVALYMDKSDKVVLIMLAIWKAGAAFLPIDASYPADRIRFMLEDSASKWIITNKHYSKTLTHIASDFHLEVQIIEIEHLLQSDKTFTIQNKVNAPSVCSSDLAYVTYTSGTTGVPKGVPKFHNNVVNSITDLSECYDMEEPGTEKVVLFAAYVFEPFIRQMLIALINSQTLVVLPDEVRRDPEQFPKFLKEHKITYLNGTGSVLQPFDMQGLVDLKRLLLVGEELTAVGLRQLRRWCHGRIINEYAFTESAFVTAIKEFAPGRVDRQNRSIGKPLRNVKCYVLGEDLKQLPIGAIGELYIGGMGVATGYLNREDLTKERFLPNPFQTNVEKQKHWNDKLYKTGDLARMLPNGELEYMGRSDFQLKLSGIRVEPGEIEAVAMKYPGVKKVVIIARSQNGGTGNYLVGYFTVENGADITEASLIDYLYEHLIRAMVPARMIQMENIPVNINGKVDRRALPKISDTSLCDLPLSSDVKENKDFELQCTCQPPQENYLVSQLREIWSNVLGISVEVIKPNDDFFRLGGQSISCIVLIAKIWKNMRQKLELEDVFKLRTLKNMGNFLHWKQSQSSNIDTTAMTNEDPVMTGHTLSIPANGLHQGFLYRSLKTSYLDDTYIMQSVYNYHSYICPKTLEKAWKSTVQKYPGLQLKFKWEKEPLQIIDSESIHLNWHFEDFSGVNSTEQENKIDAVLMYDRKMPYKLKVGPLFRVYLIKKSNNEFALIFSYHHIILDGWSLMILHDNVNKTYLSLLDGSELAFNEDAAYVAAQKYWANHHNDSVTYWQEQIAQIGERCDLNGIMRTQTKYKVDLANYDHIVEPKEKKLTIGVQTTSAIKLLCKDNQLTLHSVIQFIWHKTLKSFGGGQSTVVGTVVSGRNIPVDGIDQSVGLFINTLPLIVNHTKQKHQTVLAAIADIQTSMNAMNGQSIIKLGNLQSNVMKHGLFDTLLVLENYPDLMGKEEAQRLNDHLCFEHVFDNEKLDYPLALICHESNSELTVNLCYAGELFDESMIEILLDTMLTLLQQLSEGFLMQVCNLEVCSHETLSLLEIWNYTDTIFNTEATLHGVFEQMVLQYHDLVALVFEKNKLTYGQLNEKANQLANQLLKTAPLNPNDLVALALNKNENLIIAIFAVWKAGAAYVPIDPYFPDEKIEFMLKDTHSRILLTNKMHKDRLLRLAGSLQPVLELESLLLNGPCTPPVTSVCSTDLAYAIYTSGTTGKPKAVLVEHIGVVNLQASLSKKLSLSKEKGDQVFLSFSNYVFDHFVEQMTDALLNGQTLVILNDDMRGDQAWLLSYIAENKVTYLSGTPTVLSLYDFSSAHSLIWIDAIGEDFTVPVYNRIRNSFDGMIINGYGPTEVSITTHKRLYEPNELRLDKSIGFPVANTKCYVLNDSMKPLPIGGVGELYLGGIGVAQGYLNKEKLTADHFLKNPFQTVVEAQNNVNRRIYKTGDLVRWLINGEIECLGRTDNQVKINGHRVELGEIEAVLTSYPGVSQSCIVVQEHENLETMTVQKFIIGFYISDHHIDEEEIKQWMRLKLSKAIMPARLLRIWNIPVTATGKLDVKQLPHISFSQSLVADYIAPSSNLELQLCGIWSKVLGLAGDLVSVHDDFFSLGGDSIRAISLVQHIKNNFGKVFSVSAVFEYVTIAEQAVHIENQAAGTKKEIVTPSRDLLPLKSGLVPVSLTQQRLLFIDEFEEGCSAYNIPFCLEIDPCTAADLDSLRSALLTILFRHQALRTILKKLSDGTRTQHVLDERVAASIFKIANAVVKSKTELDNTLLSDAEHVFKLDKELPFRVTIVQHINEPYKAYLNLLFHHSCFDGWSWNIFHHELTLLCSGFKRPDLEKITSTYTEFAVWQQSLLLSNKTSELKDFWTKYLSGSEPASLPPDQPRPAKFDYRGREIEFQVDADTTEALKALARTCKVSLYSVLLAAFSLMTETFGMQKDFIIGTPYANRVQSKYENVIGFFSTLLALRVKVDYHATIKEYITSVSKAIIKAQVHSNMSFEELIRCLNIENDASRNPVVQIVFTLQDDSSQRLDIKDAKHLINFKYYKPYSNGCTKTKFDVTVMLEKNPDGLSGTFTYAASIFNQNSAHQFLSAFKNILKEFTCLLPAATAKVTDVCVLNENKQDIFLAVNDSATLSPKTAQLVHFTFHEVATKQPDLTAVVFADKRISYLELNSRTNQLANILCKTVPLHPNDLVALVLDKSDKMIESILAVWKSGAAYVPIDPSYPDDRILFILKDTEACLVLTNSVHYARVSKLAQNLQPVLDIETVSFEEVMSTAPITKASGSDLAYAIYTSGTTGKPKAVLVEHRNLYSFVQAVQSKIELASDKQEIILLFSNYVFDFSIEQIALSIFHGNVLLIPQPELTPYDDDFYKTMNYEKLSYLSGTPTQIHQINISRLKYISTVLVAGEVFQSHQYRKIRSTFSGNLYCAYGTTESTVYNTVQCFSKDGTYENILGKPMSNTVLYVLKDNLNIVPPGAVGELYLAGMCIARSYHNQSELTKQRFLLNPYKLTEEYQAKLYKTGDIVRLRSDGNIEYIGRSDTQLKINGLRIEPSEIEIVLSTYPGIQQCAVISRVDQKSNSLYLIGYVVTENNKIFEDRKCTDFLRNKLMTGMVPSYLVQVRNCLPININGKLDIQALPAPPFNQDHYVSYSPPRNRLDANLCDLWQEATGKLEIGIDDNFFKNGGDSLRAMMLASSVQKELGQRITVKDIFDFPTIREFVDNALIDKSIQVIQPQTNKEQEPLIGSCPLLPIQKWFFSLPLMIPHYWNQTFALQTPELDIQLLQKALAKVVDHHDAFHLWYKTSYEKDCDKIEQFYSERQESLTMHVLDITDKTAEMIQEQLNQWQSSFNLEKGPLWCAAYLYGFNDGSARVWFAMHHLIVDSFSWKILGRDLKIVYNGGDLGDKTCSYLQWAKALQNFVPAQGEIQLWDELIEGMSNNKILSADFSQEHCENFKISPEETEALLTHCNWTYDTNANDLLLTAFGFALRAITHQTNNYITLESHGRPPIKAYPETRDSVGWFTAMFPFSLQACDDLEQSILYTKFFHHRIPNQGIGYGLLYGTYGSNFAPLPQISFNYLGVVSQESGKSKWMWSLDTTMCGINKAVANRSTSQFIIDITSYCEGGKFVVKIDSHLTKPEVTQLLAKEFKDSLRNIVAHTLRIPPMPQQPLCMEDIFDPYILVNENFKNIAMLFILPPGEGGAESYLNNIAKNLSLNVCLVLFNNIHLSQPMDSFESLAKYYLKQIKQIQPSGPYHLLGWSFGGVLALEISLQLQENGEKVSNLFFIDSYFDVQHASEVIGLPDVHDILDPINYYYRPKAQSLKALTSSCDNIILFKAEKLNDVYNGDSQKKLFAYYKKSHFNGLDRLLPEEVISLKNLSNETHHSWVHNEPQVLQMCQRIHQAFFGDQAAILAHTRRRRRSSVL